MSKKLISSAKTKTKTKQSLFGKELLLVNFSPLVFNYMRIL